MGVFVLVYRLFYFLHKTLLREVGKYRESYPDFSVLAVLCKNSAICDLLIPGFAFWLAKKFTNDPIAELADYITSLKRRYIPDG